MIRNMRKNAIGLAALLLCCLLALGKGRSAFAQSTQFAQNSAAPQSQLALVQNGDFQQGTAAWTQYSYVAGGSSFSVENGMACIQSEENNDARLKQELNNLSPNTVYRVSADFMVENIRRDDTRAAWFGFDYSDAFVLADDTAAGWQHLEFYAKTTAKQTNATLTLALGGYGSLASGTVYIKSVEVLAQEPPAGIAALSLETLTYDDGNEHAEDNAINYNSDMLTKILMSVLCAALVYLMWRWSSKSNWTLTRTSEMIFVFGILLAALIVRIVLTAISDGYPNDTYTFASWAVRMVEMGPSQFYAPEYFCDYPPGILYLLGFSGEICRVLDVSVLQSGIGRSILFAPILLCDLAVAFLGWRYAKRYLGKMGALGILLILAFHPVILYDSAIWHQVDSVLTLFLLLTFWFLEKDKKYWASAMYGLALLCKPQALIVGPLFALPFLWGLFTPAADVNGDPVGGKRGFRPKGLLSILIGAVISFGTVILLSWPFQGDQTPVVWLFQKYFNTATSYAYGSVNAFNFWCMMGGNWVDQNTMLGFFSYAQWATIGTVLVVTLTAWFYYKSKKNGQNSMFLLAAFLLAGVFTFGPRMHERYIYPVVVFILLAYAQLRDKGILNTCCMFAAGVFANLSIALYALNNMGVYGTLGFQAFTNIVSIFMVLTFVYLTMVCYDICVKGRIDEGEKKVAHKPVVAQSPEVEAMGIIDGRTVSGLKRKIDRPTPKLHWKRIDTILMLVLTLVYAVIAFFQLGTTKVPQSYWRNASSQHQSDPDYVTGDETLVVRFAEPVEIAEVWSYGGISSGSLEIAASLNGGTETFLPAVSVNQGVMYRWHITPAVEAPEEEIASNQVMSVVADTLRITAISDVWLEELVFVGMDGQAIAPVTVDSSGILTDITADGDDDSDIAHLFDEQDLKPIQPSFLNGMYFDELYHARTAYEHLKGLHPYENTHPPLGKVMIMVGIAIFGMNPFGWRCMGTLIGVLMIPTIYLFAKRMLKQTKYAFFVSFLFTFDFMHFVQTRISTIDVYGVFFIIWMYYFIYQYWQMNFYTDGIQKTLVPLALCGIFFGLGAASKWIALYAGAGLAIVFFVSIFKRFDERMLAKSARARGEAGADAVMIRTNVFARDTMTTLVFCVVFFVCVPFFIYLASYLPYMLAQKPYSLQGVWEVQQNMFNYHSGLTARHPFESNWWTWPIVLRPIFYYSQTYSPASIAAIAQSLQSGGAGLQGIASLLSRWAVTGNWAAGVLGGAEWLSAGISSFGNPVVWWSGLVAMVGLVVRGIKRRHFDATSVFLLIAFAAQFVPWMFISRATFIYHYFASVPFIVLALGYLLKTWEKRSRLAWVVAVVLMVLTLLLFVLFYPELSGMPVQRTYLNFLRWLPTWTW